MLSQPQRRFEVFSQGLPQSNCIIVGFRYRLCVWQLQIEGCFFRCDLSPPSPGFTSVLRNIIQLSASGYNRGHVSPVRLSTIMRHLQHFLRHPEAHLTVNQQLLSWYLNFLLPPGFPWCSSVSQGGARRPSFETVTGFSIFGIWTL